MSLDSFGRNTTIFLPLTNPLIVGLTQNPVLTRTGPNMTRLSKIIISNGKALRQLSVTLEDIVDQWTTSETTFQTAFAANGTPSAASARERGQLISSINNITRSKLHQLGRNNSRLERITNPLSVTLLFSPTTLLGYTLFNANQNISLTGTNLKALAGTITEMTRKWDLATKSFHEQEGNCSVVESLSRAASLEAVDEECLASRPTARSFITSLNDKTQQTLTTFGRSYPRLQSLSTPLWLGLRFSTITEKGFTAYNYNQNISTTAAELKAFADSILQVVREWTESEATFARDSSRDCRLKTVTDAPTVAPRELNSTVAPVEAVVATENSSIASVSVSPSADETSSVIAVTSSPNLEVSTIESEVSTEAASVSSSAVETSSVMAVTSSDLETEMSPATDSVVLETSTSILPSDIAVSQVSSVVPEVSEVFTELTDTTAYPNNGQQLQENLFEKPMY